MGSKVVGSGFSVVGCRILFILVTLFLFSFVLADPTGPDSINITSNSTWAGSTSGTIVNTSGGYVSDLNITATVQDTRWKAFVGWINGAFTLDDSTGSTIYDWSISTVSGEVYATRASGAVSWGNIACASAANITAEDTALEHALEDNITSTFTGTNTGTYVVAGTSIGAGACSSIYTYVDNATQSSLFEEFILYDDTNLIFATNIEDMDGGYDGNNYDFQMIVPENGNETFSSSTAYYLYVELN